MVAGTLGAGIVSAIGLAAATEVAPGGGIDLAGVALVITAITGLIGAIGGLVIALRRRPIDPMQAALAQAFLEQAALRVTPPEEDK